MNEWASEQWVCGQTDYTESLNQDHPPRIVRLIWLYYRLDLRLAVWKQARYFSFTEAPQNTEFLSLWRGDIFKPPYQSGGTGLLHPPLHQTHCCMHLCAFLGGYKITFCINVFFIWCSISVKILISKEWILFYVAFCTIMVISRQKETRSRDYALLLFRMTLTVLYSAQYHRQHCTLQAFQQFGALYMHNHDDKYPSRPGFEPRTSRL